MRLLRLFILVICFLLLLVSGCSLFAGPDDIASQYLKAEHENNLIKMYELLSSRDKAEINKEEFLNYSPSIEANMRFLSENTSFKIDKYTIFKNKATVHIVYSMPDYDLVTELVSSDIFSGKSEIEKYDMLVKNYKNKIPLKQTDSDLPLIKEKDGWKVVLHTDQEISQEKEKLRNFKKFAPLIMFINVEVTIGGGFIFITGSVQNKTGRDIERLSYKCYFLDSDGKPYFEDSSSSFDLKSNYVEPFIFEAETTKAPNWGRKYRIEVTDIEFAK